MSAGFSDQNVDIDAWKQELDGVDWPTQLKIRDWDKTFNAWKATGFKVGYPKIQMPGKHPVECHWWNNPEQRAIGFEKFTGCKYPDVQQNYADANVEVYEDYDSET